MDWKKIDEGLVDNTSMKKACLAVGVSHLTFKKRFKEKYGMDYKDYRLQKLAEQGVVARKNSSRAIDWDYVKEHLKAKCSIASISRSLGVSTKAMYERCIFDLGCTLSDLKDEYNTVGEDMIKKVMFDKAIGGDTKMLIFLSKNWLGYSEQPTQKIEPATINFNFVEPSK